MFNIFKKESQNKENKRVCFTGHRPEKLGITEEEAKKLLKKEIENAVKDGYVTFISGMARGIDMWAAELVLEEKKKNPNLRLICASPYEGFETRWRAEERERYSRIMKEADLVRYICRRFDYSCFQIRNEWMVNHSNRVIAAYNGTSGGTKNTIEYAKTKNTEIRNIL